MAWRAGVSSVTARPLEQAQARIDAAVAAGGRVVFDASAPAWWTLEDPAGNQADVATLGGPAR